MKMRVRNNIFLKIISIIIAIVLWFVVLGKGNPLSERALTINASDIAIINTLDDSLSYRIMENQIVVTVKGDANVIDKLTPVSVDPKVDVNRLQPGKYVLPVSFLASSDFTASGNYKVDVVVFEKN